MELKKPAIAGTVESSDVMIAIQPNPGQGIDIQIQSDVMVMFGEAIEKTVRDVLAEFDVKDAKVSVNDRGALDFAIRARMQCAITRSAELSFDWSKDDPAPEGSGEPYICGARVIIADETELRGHSQAAYIHLDGMKMGTWFIAGGKK